MKACKDHGNFFTRNLGFSNDPIPIEPYISNEWFRREREKVFNRAWLCVGREENVGEPGDYLVRDIPVLNTSVLVTRAADSKVRAFHNVCQHRGNLVAQTACGHNRSRFTCTFHGWGYDLQGKLVQVPDEKVFYNLDRSRYGLKPLSCGVWNGFIFVSVDPARPLEEEFGDIGVLVKGYDFSLPVVGSYTAEVKGNWKVFLDAFQEAYHVIALHATTVRPTFAGSDNPFAHLTSARIFDRNRSISVYGNPDHRMRPSEMLAFKLGVASTYTPDMEKNAVLQAPGLNPERDKNWAFDINILFPNMELLMGVGWYAQMQFWPVAADHTHYEVRIYMKAPRDAADAISQEFNKVMLYDVLLEDLYTIENTQSVLKSGANGHFLFSDHEVACRHNYMVVSRMLEAH
jgi:phenylpropionate dioxygenase-like ring-hydroxylating dioxygenase large terminal subunit